MDKVKETEKEKFERLRLQFIFTASQDVRDSYL